MVKVPDGPVERAEAVREATDDTAAREALAGLLAAYRKLQSRYLHLYHEGHPDPWPPARPLDEADTLEALSGRWRDEADTLRGHGAEAQATSLERCASDLDIALRAFQREELTLREAAAWSGYSRKRLREMVHEGKLPDNRPPGSQGEIRLRRCDLPRKPAGDREALSPADRLYAKLSR